MGLGRERDLAMRVEHALQQRRARAADANNEDGAVDLNGSVHRVAHRMRIANQTQYIVA